MLDSRDRSGVAQEATLSLRPLPMSLLRCTVKSVEARCVRQEG